MADEVIKRCDLLVGRGRNRKPHGEVIEDGQSTKFRVNGRDYEADLCTEHRAALTEAVSDFIAVSRRSGTSLPRNARGRAVMRAKGGVMFTTKDVRRWLEDEAAAGRGEAPSPSGRIPNSDIERYKMANGLA
ncbi:histone-like nucleoid-structuring protein Lsr2 [Terracoccus sp. 273MFTsu3.1]|uniref:Lsr2 dimerization domain-containing protein n=1 Tax=Terracoccus sp. 273MFTsu3.1 TaxID=1172188 RepID=UPI00036809E4|nr:histone-like nucleoid-structuring protein Lsr2 [Terracoccus sp. 273MFTsu3.1]